MMSLVAAPRAVLQQRCSYARPHRACRAVAVQASASARRSPQQLAALVVPLTAVVAPAGATQLNPQLETAVELAEVVERVTPQAVDAATAAAEQLAAASAPLRDETARSFAPIGAALVKFAQRTATGPAARAAADQAARAATEAKGAAVAALDAARGALLGALHAVLPAGVEPETAGVALAALLALLVAARLSEAAGRRYRGELSPAAALDAVLTGGALLLDVRGAEDVQAKGRPALGRASSRLLAVPPAAGAAAERGALRDAAAVAAQLQAVRIGALKGVSRSSRLVLLGARGGGDAARVANALAAAGFSDVYLVAGGFAAWLDAKLPSAAAFRAEVETVAAQQRPRPPPRASRVVVEVVDAEPVAAPARAPLRLPAPRERDAPSAREQPAPRAVAGTRKLAAPASSGTRKLQQPASGTRKLASSAPQKAAAPPARGFSLALGRRPQLDEEDDE